jgi:PAS domain S-box-containing protein
MLLLDIKFSLIGLVSVAVIYTLLVVIIIYVTLYKRYNFRITHLLDQQKQQEKLISERKVLRALIDNIPDYIYVKDKYSRFVIANTQLSKVLRVKSPQLLIGKTDHDFYPKELADMFYNDEQDIIKSGTPIINKDEIGMDEESNSRYFSTTKVPYRNENGEIVGIIGIGRDITKQKMAESKLKQQADDLQEINVLLEERQEKIQQQSEQLAVERDRFEKEHKQLRTLIDSIPDFIYFKDSKARFITTNKKILNVYKVQSLDQVIGKTDHDFYPKELADNYYRDDIEVMKKNQPLINKEEIVYDEFGQKLFLSTTKIPLQDDNGEVFGLVGIGRDITKQKQTEEQLKKQSDELQEMNVLLEERSEEILQQSDELKNQRDILEQKHLELITLFDTIPDFIYFKDIHGRIVTANEKFVKVVKSGSLEKVIGKTDFDLFQPEMAQKNFDDDMKVMKEGIPIVNKEDKGLDDMGNIIYLSNTKFPLRRENGEIFGLVGIGRDITEMRKITSDLQKQARELQELNVILEERQEEIMQQSEELRNQKERITKEHSLLRTLIDNIPDRIYFKDEKARFITGNKKLANILKADSIENLIGKTDYEFYPKEMADKFYEDDMEVIRTGKAIINREQTGWDEKSGSIVLSTTKVPMRDESEKIIGLVGIGRDITELKKVQDKLIEQAEYLKEVNVLLEERQEEIYQQSEELSSQAEHLKAVNHELEKLSAVASQTDNSVLILQTNGEIEFANDGFCQLYNFPTNEIIGKNAFKDFSAYFSAESKNRIQECIKNKTTITYESSPKNKQGEHLWLNTTLTPIVEQGRTTKVIAVESDISELKKAEIEIEKQRDTLKVLNSTKDKFFSIIAHDLKNPFHAIIGFTDFLSQNFERVKENEKKRILELINGTSRSTYNLLENLLNWARTQTNAIRFNPRVFDINEVIAENIKLLQISANKKNIEMINKIPELEMVYADINMINTVVRNLLTNAIKFTDENGKIITGIKTDKNMVTLSIQDNGMGMDQDTVRDLFQIDAYKTTMGTSGETGTGLGLIICQEFVRKNNGEIYATSEPGVGTTFFFTIPRHEDQTTNP